MADSRYLSQEEAAAYLRVTTRYLRAETVAGRVPASKVGRKMLYTVEDLDEYVRSRRDRGGREKPPATD